MHDPIARAWLLALLLLGCQPSTVGAVCRLRASAPCKDCVDCYNSTCEPTGCADAGPGVTTCSLGMCRVPCHKSADCTGFSDCDTCGADGFCAQSRANACREADRNRTGVCHPVLDHCGGSVICSPCPAGEVCSPSGACAAGP